MSASLKLNFFVEVLQHDSKISFHIETDLSTENTTNNSNNYSNNNSQGKYLLTLPFYLEENYILKFYLFFMQSIIVKKNKQEGIMEKLMQHPWEN